VEIKKPHCAEIGIWRKKRGVFGPASPARFASPLRQRGERGYPSSGLLLQVLPAKRDFKKAG